MATANATWLPPPPPPPPSPPPFTSVGCEDADACSYFDVSDREIVTSLGIFATMGAVLLVTFGAIRHQAPIFFGRRRLRNLVRGGRARAMTRSESRETRERTAFFSFKTGRRLFPRQPEARLTFSDLSSLTTERKPITHRHTALLPSLDPMERGPTRCSDG